MRCRSAAPPAGLLPRERRPPGTPGPRRPPRGPARGPGGPPGWRRWTGGSARMLQNAAALLAMNTEGLSPRQREELARQVEQLLRQGLEKGLFELPANLPEPPPSKATSAPSPPTKPKDPIPVAPAKDA